MRSAAALLVLMASCAPDAPPPAPPAPEPAPPAPIAFEAPPAWVKEAPSNNMRIFQYRVPDKQGSARPAEMTVIHSRVRVPFGDNVTRWVAQMGATEPKTESLKGKLEVDLADLAGTYTGDLSGEPLEGARMLAAAAYTDAGTVYFKFVGPADTVGDWRDEFVALLKGASR